MSICFRHCWLCFLTFIEFYLFVIQSYTFENNVLTVQNIKILNLAKINSKAAASVFLSSYNPLFAALSTFGRRIFPDHALARTALSSMGCILCCCYLGYLLLPSFFLYCMFLFLVSPISPSIRHFSSSTFP